MPDALTVIRGTEVGDAFDQNTFHIVEAANTLMLACETDDQITLDDLLKCLDFGGVIAEMGARGLYLRTGRDGLGWSHRSSFDAFKVDRADWEQYLRTEGLL